MMPLTPIVAAVLVALNLGLIYLLIAAPVGWHEITSRWPAHRTTVLG